MPCDTYIPQDVTPQQRANQIDKALEKLSAGISQGTIQIKVGPQGAVAFAGWADADRSKVTDVCAFRRLSVSNSFTFKTALAKAEAVAGRKASANAVGAGTHSHDGGNTWHKGH